jgi:Flp pilus assembly protein TadD
MVNLMAWRLVAAVLSLTFATLLPASAQSPSSASRPASPAYGNGGLDPAFQPLDTGPGTSRVQGSVRTFDGHPIADANITVRDNAHAGRFFGGVTDAAGNFVLFNIPPGDYEVVATHGTDQASEDIQVRSGSIENSLDLRMQTSPTQSKTIGPAGSTVSLAEMAVPEKARSLLMKATDAYSKGKNDEARSKVDAALAVCPRYAQALTLRGLLKVDAGNREEAIADFTEAIQNDPKYPTAYLALASSYNSIGRFDDSLPLLDEVEKLAPNAWQTYFEMSRAEVGKKNYRAALANLDHASKLEGGPEKEVPESHLVRAYALIGLAEIPRAVAEFHAYLNKVPTGHLADKTRKLLDQLQTGTITSASK